MTNVTMEDFGVTSELQTMRRLQQLVKELEELKGGSKVTNDGV